MRIIKKKSKQTYTNSKTGKECHYYNYYVELDNGKRIQIKTAYDEERKLLDVVAVYER